MVEFDLLQELEFVLDFQQDVAPQKNFRLGPHGLEPIINLLCRFRRFVKASSISLPMGDVEACVVKVDLYGAAIYSALLSFRAAVDREHYDPPDFAGIRKVLRTRREIFPVADDTERFTVLGLCLNEEGRIVSDDCLLVGHHGIDGFMMLADDVLDVLPVDHASYERLCELFGGVCKHLGQRMSNYTKSHGKQKKQGSETASETTSKYKDEGRAYGTRSSSRSQYNS
ncbi:hypothetical protein B0H15DRAFT_805557 [Mycena belliarum]|uniref:Uncharacterized protein n=1 Tax=Mycena belliarum TaxID=1033014 RepID=A0AAD6TR74_9AGAR|nr:hypothetical protein B0H15DRAFT_805557 [Mycena belliae]